MSLSWELVESLRSHASSMLDKRIQQLLRQFEKEGIPPAHTLTVAEARRLSREMVKRFAGSKPHVALVRNITADAENTRIPVRVYVPRRKRGLPVIVYYHGGGWVLGDLDAADWLCRSLALAADCVIFSIDYRLAPENKFPTPVEDCYRATKWVAQNGFEYYADVSRLAVGGDSAGGNLAAAACLMARDRGTPAISYQLLLCPVTNHSFDTESYRQCAEGYLLTLKDMQWFWNHYLREPEDGNNPYASPLLGDLHSLPPALIITAEFDPLRDEGEAYAKRMQEAEVVTNITRYGSMIHNFTDFPDLTQAQKTINQAAHQLRRVLATNASHPTKLGS